MTIKLTCACGKEHDAMQWIEVETIKQAQAELLDDFEKHLEVHDCTSPCDYVRDKRKELGL